MITRSLRRGERGLVDRLRRRRRTAAVIPLLFSLIPSAASAEAAAPHWAQRHEMLVVLDSVLLSGYPAIGRAMPNWKVSKAGRPAIMLDVAEREIRARTRVPALVVIGVGHNSLWEKGRRNHARWARRFDSQARRLLATLRARGARQFVWVTLRHPTSANTPRSGYFQISQYGWYFPYVNERLRALARERDDLILADWTRAGRDPGLTYDAIHLTARGAAKMAATIEDAIRGEERRQAVLAGAATSRLARVDDAYSQPHGSWPRRALHDDGGETVRDQGADAHDPAVVVERAMAARGQSSTGGVGARPRSSRR